MKKKFFIGRAKPLGATLTEKGVNFALFSKNATQVTLYIKEAHQEQNIPLDPERHRTGKIWHVLIKDLTFPFHYAFKVDGPHEAPYLFKPEILLTDPYALYLDTPTQWGEGVKQQPIAFFEKKEPFDWQGVSSPGYKMKDLIIYEMHVRSFTNHPSSGVTYPGTYQGIIEKIPYLLELGVNAIELMPLQEFNECEYRKIHPETKEQLFNYWGYSTLNYFMPMRRYSSGQEDCICEFKKMVRELHRNGIEVILDIVFNHTGEKADPEILYSFRGIDHATYYMLKGNEECNYTGCGHTMNLNHPVMRKFVRECLSYWVTEMHIDGFRFDLAPIMNRDTHGKLLQPSALIEELTYDPILSDTKLIAEPWDLAGYQLGGFYPEESRWSEWNDKYRDAVRKFIKGDPHSKNEFAGRILGSQDIFPARKPSASINFVTAHDGFSLADLVSYNEKHNEANGEENRDGNSNNMSWNCGAEGETNDINIFNLRQRQIKNFFFALLLSKGVPMLLMGDEYCHTKMGNNNTWCHDNELNWFIWDHQSPICHFVQRLIQFRKRHSFFTNDEYTTEVQWFGADGKAIQWEDPAPFLAFLIEEEMLFIAFNATSENVVVTLPEAKEGKQWRLLINTNATFPYDIMEEGRASLLRGRSFTMEKYSSILLKLI